MGSAKHEKSFVDFEKPYEQNVIGLKGIIYFGVGLVILIVITFLLMWALNSVLEENAKVEKKVLNPYMIMTENERLPPEPRLQSAPGFGVESSTGKVNLELREPQAEYRELRKQWDEVLKNGHTDAKTGTIVAMPMEQAKERFLQQNVKARSGPEAEKALNDVRLIISDGSSGRVASLKRR
jgi:hypothetical protein